MMFGQREQVAADDRPVRTTRRRLRRLAAGGQAPARLLLGEAEELLGRRGLRPHGRVDPTIVAWRRRRCGGASRSTSGASGLSSRAARSSAWSREARTPPACGTRFGRSATASRHSTSTTVCGALSRTPTRASAPSASAHAVVEAAGTRADRGGAARPAVRGRAPNGCARPGTPRPTRSRRFSTGSRRAGRPSGIRARRDDGVVRPLLPVWRDETAAYCVAEGLEYRVDSSNSRHEARADSRRDPAAAPPAASGRRPEPPACARAPGARFRGRSSGPSPSSSRPPTVRSASTSAEAGRPSGSTTVGLARASPQAPDASGSLGPVADRAAHARPASYGAGDRATGSRVEG